VETILGQRAAFSGTLRSETSIRIDGTIEGGVIETPANVLLGDSARVAADIVAKTVSVLGSYQGTLRAERAEFLGRARVSGAIHVNSLYVDDTVQLQAEIHLRGMVRTVAQRPSDIPRPIPVVGAKRAANGPSGPPAAPTAEAGPTQSPAADDRSHG